MWPLAGVTGPGMGSWPKLGQSNPLSGTCQVETKGKNPLLVMAGTMAAPFFPRGRNQEGRCRDGAGRGGQHLVVFESFLLTVPEAHG